MFAFVGSAADDGIKCLFFSVSYTEIVNFIQGYIDNEINFNREDTCSKQCSDFRHVDYHICRNDTLCILNYLDKNKTRCDGDIRSCEFIESNMRVCPNVSIVHVSLTKLHFHSSISYLFFCLFGGKCFSRKMIEFRIVDTIIFDTVVVCCLAELSFAHMN